MADPWTRTLVALISVGGLAFLCAPFLISRPYKFMPRGRAFLTRALSCVIAAGYFLAAYIIVHDDRSSGSIALVLGCTAALNIILVVLEWPYLKRARRET